MSNLIDRQTAIDVVEESRRLNHHRDGKEACAHEFEHRHFLKILRELPSAESERKNGKWIIYVISLLDGEDVKCSECGQCGCAPNWNFCPNCGAKMTEVENETD